jgi:hypothetical protein
MTSFNAEINNCQKTFNSKRRTLISIIYYPGIGTSGGNTEKQKRIISMLSDKKH